jgi:alpha-tubulin suppressor-like RCC1 family protein
MWDEFELVVGTALLPSDYGYSTAQPPPNTVQLAAGRWAICALQADGGVQCKGNDVSGVLGRGRRERIGTTGTDVFAPVVGIHDAIEVAIGDQHACVVLSDGQVQCWGRDEAGQLGNGYVYSNFPRGLTRPDRVRERVSR